MDDQEKFLRRRLEEDHLYEVIDDHIELKRLPLTKQKKVRVSRADYTFLQYSYIINKWALGNHDLTSMELNMLLYVYPIIVLTRAQFLDMQKELSATNTAMFKSLVDRGWFLLWSKKSRKSYYVLSHKGNQLVSRMHRMYMLEERIPISTSKNVAARKNTPQNKKLMELYQQFNDNIK